jgi:tripartite-type tricarboxylate transporter receptor subunit TctC
MSNAPLSGELSGIDPSSTLVWPSSAPRSIAPAKLPKPLLTKIHDTLTGILKEPQMQKIIFDQGASPVGNSPEEFRKYLLADMEKWQKVVKASGAKAY